MSFNEQTIKKIAKLARLSLSPDAEPKFMQDIDSILSWVEELQEVNVTNVEPLISVSMQQAVSRADEVTDGGIQQDLMQNAPESAHGFYVVPKMVE